MFRYIDISTYLCVPLPRKNRLTSKKEIDRVFKNGTTVRGSFLFVRFVENDKGYLRFAFVVPSKYVQLAVNRNRVKRVLSEFVRKSFVPKSKDIIVTVYKKLDKKNIDNLAVDLRDVFSKVI